MLPEYELLSVPVKPMALIERIPVPVFFSVMICAALAVPTVEKSPSFVRLDAISGRGEIRASSSLKDPVQSATCSAAP